MRALRAFALVAGCVSLFGAPVAAQTPIDPQAAQVSALRKEVQRQRKAHGAIKKDLEVSRAAITDLEQRDKLQEEALDSLRRELARAWAWGAVGFALLFFVLVIIGLRRPPSSRPDELQQRLAALDRKLQDLSPRC
jgi:hypothetical protein